MTNISFVLAVYNRLELTKECYKNLRHVYPDAPLVISSGGSNDGTIEWLQSLEDDNLSFYHDDERITFSDNYNAGIKLVDTEKLVLIHNDMVIGQGFLESIERLLKPNMLLSYTTIEPPIFKGHQRPGKVLLDLGSGFYNFDRYNFENYVSKYNGEDNDTLYNGAVFFMSGYKEMFENVGGFDGFSFKPCFCEDDDFLIRAKLKGYDLKTCSSAIVYHFVSQTSRFSEEMKNNRQIVEFHSVRNFIRKWGIPISSFNELRYWDDDKFTYKTFNMCLVTRNKSSIAQLEPFFDKIDLGEMPEEYIQNEQLNTNYDLKSKFLMTNNCDVVIYEMNKFTDVDFHLLHSLRVSIPHYEPGEYEVGNMKIEIRKKI